MHQHFQNSRLLWLLCFGLLGSPLPAQELFPAPQVPELPETALQRKANALVEGVYEYDMELTVQKRRSKLLRLKERVFRVAVADPEILELVAFGTTEVEIIGKERGATTVTLWLGSEDAPQLISLLVTVEKDQNPDENKEMDYRELQDRINELFPNSKIQLIPIADKLIVRGQARDEKECVQIMSILQQNAQSLSGPGGPNIGAQVAGPPAANAGLDYDNQPVSNLINMLMVPGEKQVLLKVRIAELKRSAVRRLGIDFDLDVADFAVGSALTGGGNAIFSGTFDSDTFGLVIQALENNGSAKILAEPNLTTISGQSANFIAGGEFAVPTVVGIDGAQAATTSFKGFGTQLTFTPTVLDHDRIRLMVSPTFSTLNSATSVNGIFGLDTRSVSTTVDLREGQVLAIAGLLQEQQRGEVNRIPWLGELPYLQSFFSNKSISRDETELIILVSPELVHAMEPEDAPTILPGMEVTEPDDLEFFFHGNIEGRPEHHHRSTVWPTYANRMKRVREVQSSQEYYLQGNHGFSD